MDLSLLNARQQEAVRETEGYVRVIAGAGSGKTKLLVSRYVYLVTEYGIDSKNILCVTFTNKAAGEMKRRIRALIGPGYDTTLICTYHGFCNRLIREDSEKLFLPKEFQIIDSTQQKSMMSEIFRKYELKLDYASYENVLKQIAIVKEMGEYVPRMCTPEKCHILERIESLDDQIVEDFLQKQKATYTLDFNDLLQYALYLLNKDEDVRIKWQKRLNYIQVDEFQDSAKTEMRLIDILSDHYKNLMIVGDPDQNIYEWRGSDVKLLVDFDQGHPDTKTVILNQNYRSTPQILTCANTLIENNQLRLKKDLFTENPAGIPVYHYHSKSDFEETDSIVDQIRKVRRQENLRYSDFAILYRSGFLSRVIEKKLVEKSIPYEIYGGVKFYQRMEILDILAYLKLVAYDDDVSFRRIVNTPHRRFGREKMNLLSWHQEMEEAESGNHVSLLNTLKTNLNETKFKESDAQNFIRLIESFRREKTGICISELVNRVAAESGYEEYIRSLGDEERLDNLAEFKRIANDFEQEFGEDLTLEQFLEQIALQAGEDREEETDAVKLMTIHASKGLEFPVVFLVGLSEGVFPSPKTIEERKDEGLEEERRLCYVAITRARERLYLMDSEGATKNGTPKILSRFLDEIGDENYVRIGKISKDLQDLSRKSVGGNENRRLPHTPNDMLKVGDTVQHHAFGQGKIIGLDKTRKNYQIQFDKLNSPRTITSDYFRKEHAERPQKVQETEADEPLTISAESTAAENEIEESKSPPLQAVSNDEMNLWKRPDVPHSGWVCEGVSDLGAPVGTCEMCGHQIIRYAHHMSHPGYHSIVAGCICAGKMEGNIERAKQRESEFKSRMRKQERIKTGRWKVSRNGNEYQEIDGHLVILFQSIKSGWKYAVDGEFSGKTYNSREDAINAALEKLR